MYARIEAARSSVKYWEDLKADLEATVSAILLSLLVERKYRNRC